MIDEKKLSKYILNECKKGNIKKDIAVGLIRKISYQEPMSTDIAIIGMGCRFREEDEYNEYWKGLIQKKTWVDRCKKERVHTFEKIMPNHCLDDISKHSKGAFINNLYDFDYRLFGFTKEEAKIMSPSQRMMLETAYRCLDDAGYLGERLKKNRTGVIIGNNFTSEIMVSHPSLLMQNGIGDENSFFLNWSSGLATRVSRQFNLKGPSYVIDLSCASGSMALYNAYQSLLDKTCDMVLVGGVNISYKPCIRIPGTDLIYEHDDFVIQRCYDENPGGAYIGEGVGALLVKPLQKAIEDGDQIHAVVKGSSVINSGSEVEFISSSAVTIKDMVLDVIKKTKIDVESIGYVEGEGYTNKVEEMIQTSGMNEAFKTLTSKRQFCGIGSICGNMGYMQAAIGMFAAIKCVLTLKNNTIAPNYHFLQPNSMFNFSNSTFYVNDIAKQWEKPENGRRCTVSYTFAYGGNNLFTIYEEAPEIERTETLFEKYLFILSANTKKSFDQNLRKYIEFLENPNESSMLDLCYTASVGRKIYRNYRLAVVVSNKEELVEELKRFQQRYKPSEKLYYGMKDVNEQDSIIKRATHEIENDCNYEKLAKEFVDGTNYKFSSLYQGYDVRISSLPSYQFDRERCCAFDDVVRK